MHLHPFKIIYIYTKHEKYCKGLVIILITWCTPIGLAIFLSGDCHLFVMERLAWTFDPKSDTVWSYTPGRVIHGGKVKGEVP